MKKTLLGSIVLVSLVAAGYAVETRTWLHSSQADFEKGVLKRISLRSDGRLTLAPKTDELLDSSTSALWAVAGDSKGNVYAGGGGPGARAAEVFRIDRSGNAETIAELEGLQVQALAVNSKDEVFAATAPDGAIYRVTANGGGELFFEPAEKYIWAMVFDGHGDLFVGTGDSGAIYRVHPDGEGSVFFKTEETHARSLAVDRDGNLIAGTEPSGLIMRISPSGESFVLHQSEKREITTVAVAPDGSIYAAGVGTKKSVPSMPLPRPVTPAKPPTAGSPASSNAPQGTAATPASQRRPAVSPLLRLQTQATGGSHVYRIGTDGYPQVVWSDNRAIVYSIAVDAGGRLVFGTGNEGRIFRLDSDHLSTMLVKVPSTQVTSVLANRSGMVYAAASNIGKLYRLGPDLETEGSYEGEVLDAGHFAYWGRIRIRNEESGGAIAVEARSGNLDRPQRNWSPWSPVALEAGSGRVAAPPARFLQYKLTLKASPDGASPRVASLETAYLHKNVAPVIEKIEATPPNYRFPPRTLSITQSKNLTLPPLSGVKRTTPMPAKPSATQTMQYEKGKIGARWLASDENNDKLRFKVEIRGIRESEWKLLKEEVEYNYLSWDSTAFADGEYRLRVTASDEPGNPPHQALTATLEGGPFLIDNTPPEVAGLTGEVNGGELTARWAVGDGHTVIKKTEYSLDGGEWTMVEPTSRLSDSRELEYALTIDGAGPGEHTLAIRVTDLFDNQSVATLITR